MREVPREAFVPEAMREFAYEDTPLPIEDGQTISQPYIVALMIEAADVAPGDRVLEIGAGSGYAAAVLARDRRAGLHDRAPSRAGRARARAARASSATTTSTVRTGDGTRGWPEQAPFDAIVVAAGGPRVPEALRAQLAVGGRLVMPVGDDADAPAPAPVTRTGDETRGTERGARRGAASCR